MPKLICTLIFFFCLLLRFQDVFCRSINIDFSHKYNFASDDYEDQESVDLDELETNVRNELEKNLKEYQEQLKVVNFEIPTNETETNIDIRDRNDIRVRNGSRKDPLIPKILGVADPETTENTNGFNDTSLPPPEAEVHPRLKRRAQNPGFEISPDKAKAAKTNAFVDKMQKMLLKKVLIYVAIGVAVLFVVCMVCTCCCLAGPQTCFIATITSPCCLIVFPCVISYIKEYLDPETILSENTYSYIPGIMVHENGKLQKYPPSPDEIAAVRDIMEIVKQMNESE